MVVVGEVHVQLKLERVKARPSWFRKSELHQPETEAL